MRSVTAPAATTRRFGWIDDLALPLATSVMEAQPVGLLPGLAAVVTSETARTAPLGAGGTALVLLVLAWWARLLHAWEEHGLPAGFVSTLSIIGWLVTLALASLPYAGMLAQEQDIAQIVIGALVVTWAWRRGARRAQQAWEYEDVQADFKVALGVVLGVLVLTGLTAPHSDLLIALAGDLPVFFLSGLLAVSLARLAVLRRQRTARQADPTRLWLVALLSLVMVLVAAALGLEALVSFTTFQQGVAMLGPVGQGLGTLVTWLLYAIVWLLAPIFLFFAWLAQLLSQHTTTTAPNMPPAGTPTPQPTPPTPQPATASPVAVDIIIVVIMAVALAAGILVLALLVAGALRRWHDRTIGDGIEELREGIDPRAELRQRRRDHAQEAMEAAAGTELEPQSVRARYREVLEAAQATGTDLARRPAETPAEYEMRILAALSQRAGGDLDDARLVGDLTRAYRAERYGGATIALAERERLRAALPGLIARLFPPAPAAGRRRERRGHA